MESSITPDWRRCRTDLEWSWRRATARHRLALDLHANDREGAGFEILLSIQRENPSVQADYRACRATGIARFWEMAWDASKLEEPLP